MHRNREPPRLGTLAGDRLTPERRAAVAATAPQDGYDATSGVRPAFAIALFFAGAAVALLLSGGQFHNLADEWYPYAATESMAKHLAMAMDSAAWASTTGYPWQRFGRGGHLYPVYSPIQSASGVPLYWIALHDPALGLARLTLLTNGLVSAATNVLLFILLLRLGYRRSIALLVAVAYAMGTLALVYAKSYYSEPLSAAFLLLAIVSLTAWGEKGRPRDLALVGLGLGLLVTVRPTFVLAVPVCALYGVALAHRRRLDARGIARALLLAAVPFCLCMLLLGGLDWLRFGNPLDMGYGNQAMRFDAPFLVGFVGQLVSPGRGVFIFCPVLLLSLAGARAFWRRDRALATTVGALCVLIVCVYAPWHAWFGGSHAWGPRYLVPLLSLAILPTAETCHAAFRPRRRLTACVVGAVLLASIVIQVAGAAFNYIAFVDDLFARHHVQTAHEDVQLIPLYFRLTEVQAVRQFAFSAPRYSDVAWRYAGPNGATAIAWRPLGVLLLFAAASVGLCVLTWRSSRIRWTVPATVAVALLFPASTAVAFIAYGQIVAARPDPFRTIYQALDQRALPGDALVTVSIAATSEGFQYDASPAWHIGVGREDALPISLNVRRYLERADARAPRVWSIIEGSPDRIDDWIAAGGSTRVVAHAGNLALRVTTNPSGPVHDAQVDFAHRFALVGYRIERPAPRAGGQLAIDLWWRAIQPGATDITVFVHLLNARGQLVAQGDAPPRAGMAPTATWQPGELLRDRHRVLLPRTLPAGSYTLTVGLYHPPDGARLPATTSGRPWPNGEATLARVVITGYGR